MKHILTTALLLLTTTLFGQTKKVEFYGYSLMQYQRPIPQGDGTYRAYYQNKGEKFSNGRFELNEASKTFLIKWDNGEDWLAKFTKKAVEKDYQDLNLGFVTKITFNGKWTDDDVECEFRILQTDKNECVIELRTVKVIDNDKGINVWKKAFRFFVRGCLDNNISTISNEEQESSKSENKFPFIIGQTTYDELTDENSQYISTTDTNKINKLLTSQLKKKLISLNNNPDLLSDYSFAKIGERKINNFKVTFLSYRFDGDGIFITTVAIVTKEGSDKIIDSKEVSDYSDSDFESKLVTLVMDKTGKMKLTTLVDKKKPTTKLLMIDSNGKIVATK